MSFKSFRPGYRFQPRSSIYPQEPWLISSSAKILILFKLSPLTKSALFETGKRFHEKISHLISFQVLHVNLVSCCPTLVKSRDPELTYNLAENATVSKTFLNMIKLYRKSRKSTLIKFQRSESLNFEQDLKETRETRPLFVVKLCSERR